jgi:Na+/H+ antiporter NhaC
MARWQVGVDPHRVLAAAGRGARIVLPALAILWLATAMSRMTSNRSASGEPSKTAFEFHENRLYTGDYLKEQLLAASGGSPQTFARWMPTVVFLLAGVVSFCTGTAYGTMGILVPMVVPLAAATVGGSSANDLISNEIFIGTLGCVLAGTIMGDHVSPVSDTAIMSAQASCCDLMAHVYTQIVYAAVVGVVSTLLGTVLVGFGVSVWIILPLQSAALAGVILALGKRVDQ